MIEEKGGEIMAPKPMQLHTPRLCLQPFSPEDGASMARLLTDPAVGETYMVPEFPSPDAVQALFERFRGLSLDPERLVYGIYREGTLIRFANEVHREGSAMEVGYVIDPAHKGQGYATEALMGLIRAVFSMGFDTLRAGAFERNLASLRVMEKCGLRPTGETEAIAYRGKTHRCICCQISMEEITAAIQTMETLFDRLQTMQAEEPQSVQTPEFREDLQRLTDYYEGGTWLCHYQMDEMDLLPPGLKRGVLSQDGVYNFLASLQ
jgi:RimJ/RimL family protein N-acetyltransferase